MQILGLCLLVQVFLIFGVAGILWPEKFMSLFGVLMFPWQANSRIIRANGMLAIAAYLGIIAILIVGAL
jgi:K+-transporting ATPase c subunit